MTDLWAREKLSEGCARRVALASLSLCLSLNNPTVNVRLPFFALQLYRYISLTLTKMIKYLITISG